MTFIAPNASAFHTRSSSSSSSEGFAPQDETIVNAVKNCLVFMASAGQDQPVMVHAMADSRDLRNTLQGAQIPFFRLSEVVSTMEADNHDGGNGQAVKITRFRFVRGAMQKFPSWVLAKTGDWVMQVIIAHGRGVDFRWASTAKGQDGQATNYPGLNAYCLPGGNGSTSHSSALPLLKQAVPPQASVKVVASQRLSRVASLHLPSLHLRTYLSKV